LGGRASLRELLTKRLGPGVPVRSTIHAVLDRHGLVEHARARPPRATGTALSQPAAPNDLWCTDFKGEFRLGNRRCAGDEDAGGGLHPPRPYCGLPELEDPLHDRDIVVPGSGGVGFCGSPVVISSVLAGQRLGRREVETDVWRVSFMPYDLGYIDLEARTLQTIDTPFAAPPLLP
jgi:hypothetical protein